MPSPTLMKEKLTPLARFAKRYAKFGTAGALAVAMTASLNVFANSGTTSLKNGEYLRVNCGTEDKKDEKYQVYLKPGQKLEGDKKIECTSEAANKGKVKTGK